MLCTPIRIASLGLGVAMCHVPSPTPFRLASRRRPRPPSSLPTRLPSLPRALRPSLPFPSFSVSFPCSPVFLPLCAGTRVLAVRRACAHMTTRCAVGTQCSGTRIRATVSLETRSTRRRAWSSTARPAKRTCRSGLATPS